MCKHQKVGGEEGGDCGKAIRRSTRVGITTSREGKYAYARRSSSSHTRVLTIRKDVTPCALSRGEPRGSGLGFFRPAFLTLEIVRRVGWQAGSYLRLIDACLTQLKAQGPATTCNGSKEEEEDGRRTCGSVKTKGAGAAHPITELQPIPVPFRNSGIHFGTIAGNSALEPFGLF